MASQTATTATRRSKISAEREQEIYDAVLALLREGGYEALTFESVAARTRASRSTLYRQWKTKPQLVASALSRCDRRTAWHTIDTGTLAGDLREVARAVGRARAPDREQAREGGRPQEPGKTLDRGRDLDPERHTHRDRVCDTDTALLYALGHAALSDPGLLKALHEALFAGEVSVIAGLVRRAVERGEVAADNPAAEFVPAQIIGALRVRPLLEGRPADDAYLQRFLEASVFPALGLPRDTEAQPKPTRSSQ
ncbi:TetR/AcrR family transcriptional regulator [Streptomyces sp. GC420]|uniref:TetR/AcrR family transcriptional regulator n=1 Tax=Streptomyces sp. GC420 TaxID=2697568 RepID=UPI001414D70F|nr:TetR/AcrR family transcriptional regulator [Streptomyces sp. GC420]NBM20680.1 TetR family transcriptional regulator [Streptomyces sp. GC420]